MSSVKYTERDDVLVSRDTLKALLELQKRELYSSVEHALAELAEKEGIPTADFSEVLQNEDTFLKSAIEQISQNQTSLQERLANLAR